MSKTNCDACDGEGTVTCVDCDGVGHCFSCGATCPECEGMCYVDCYECGGDGYINHDNDEPEDDDAQD